ncbi:LLM class F420-dependent oxidoreductase [Mycobacteroides abscessus]|uniref:LLM class F420-dependent oxidoreductase n=1 Tax=Mycobacteroides abscessus TaxID=36809 RepID=UPI002107B73A|nr:LLM class F420-dependent oxidoreductase [Mycobacteroides abscessus]
MTRPVRIGVFAPAQHVGDYQVIRDRIRVLEDLDVDVVFGQDHFFPATPADGSRLEHGEHGGLIGAEKLEGPNFEGWSALAAWAEQTQRVTLGMLVTGAGYRNPDLLADMARTVDHISGGRLILGLGAGWFDKDYREYGYDFGTIGSRQKLFDQALPRIKDRLTKLNPAPAGELPLLIGGVGEKKALPRIARHADIWHAVADTQTIIAKSLLLNQYAEQIGRNPAGIERASRWENPTQADTLVQAGFSLFVVSMPTANYPLDAVHDAITWRNTHRN